MATRRSSEPSRSVTPKPVAPETPATKRAGKSRAAAAAKSKEFSAEARHAMIAEAAYLRSERRGFAPGYEVEDWLTAESEVDALLRAGNSSPAQ